MYYAAEREFTAFDYEFSDAAADSVEAGAIQFKKNVKKKKKR